MKVIYIAHPISGDIEANIQKILHIVQTLNRERKDIIPFAPYVVDCLALDDNDPEDRARGIANDTHFFNAKVIDEVWLYGDKISNGMFHEISLAESLGIKVVAKSPECIECMDMEG